VPHTPTHSYTLLHSSFSTP